MNGARFAAIIVLAAVAVGVGASSATAENPEILPNPTEKEPLTFTGEGGSQKLETTGGLTLKCVKVKVSGTFTSARLGTGTLDCEGAKESKTGAACNTPGDAKEVVLLSGNLHLVTSLISFTLRLEWVVKTSAPVQIDCSILTDTVTGATIGKVTGVTSGTKTKTAKLVYKETKGVQELTKCELDKAFCEGKEYKLEAKLGEKLEQAALEGEMSLTFGKEFAMDF